MNYLTDSRRNALASEYVLGTLKGPARIRFQRLLMQHQDMRQTLWRWENHLNALGGSLRPQVLPPHVWEKIQTQLGFNDVAAQTNLSTATVVKFPTAAIKKWQWLTGLSAAAAIIFAVLLFVPSGSEHISTPQLAIVQSEKSQALWVIELNEKNINVQATTTFQAQHDRDYELWIVAKDGRAPISLGLLPKQGRRVLPRADIIDKVEIAALAVSLEPLGGSPNGQPTTVLYTADLVAI
ncbi:MAG: anti-sigma factor [Moraxellaceae bacterium]|nr:MAG: anti-sigma factor [Moraxellaceae bacterium]